jgi:serine/threonine-protein kinase
VDVEQSSGSVDPLIGKVIHDRFRIVAPIARGGMGAVYKAEQAPLGRLVALKVLSPRHDEEKDPEFKRRFFLEAATVAKLTHPNTVTVFDYGSGDDDNLFFIAMELLEGVTLRQAIKADGCFAPARALHVAKQICRSLREAHRLGVIHRDMKPGNVMLLSQGDEADYVKVLDFGLVKDVGKPDEDTDLTQQGIFMGSPKYMSPEQIQGEKVDARSDIYAVGVLLFEMLTGRAPFVRDKQVQILMDHLRTPVPPIDTPEGIEPVPPEVRALVLRCLAKKPEDRFDDMDQLLAAMKTLEGEGARHSGELFVGTPVSGVHAVGPSGAGATTGSGSISVTLPSTSGSVPVSIEPPSSAPASTSVPPPPSMAGKLAIVGGALAIGVAVAIVVFVVRPFGGDDAAHGALPTVELPTEPAPAADEGSVVEEPATAAPAPRSLMVELDSEPPGATVRIGETDYGPTPARVELTGDAAEAGRDLDFVFRHDGFRETTVTRALPEDGELTVSARLRRVPVHSTSSGRSARSTHEPTVTPAGYRESPY